MGGYIWQLNKEIDDAMHLRKLKSYKHITGKNHCSHGMLKLRSEL